MVEKGRANRARKYKKNKAEQVKRGIKRYKLFKQGYAGRAEKTRKNQGRAWQCKIDQGRTW